MRIKAIVIACFLAIGVCLGSAGCGGKEPVKAAAEKPVVLKAVTNNPKNSGHYRGLEIYKNLVEERTGGRVLVELYSDGVMGDEEEMAEVLPPNFRLRKKRQRDGNNLLTREIR